jgi:hypothetical protein
MGELHLDIIVGTACSANSRWRPTSAPRRLRTRKPSERLSAAKAALSASLAPRPKRALRPGDRAFCRPAAVRIRQQDRRRNGSREYIAPIDAGIQEAMGSGVLGGYPVVDLRVTLVDRVVTTRSTPPRWPSRSPARWVSRTAAARRIRFCSTDHSGAVEVMVHATIPWGDVMGDIQRPARPHRRHGGPETGSRPSQPRSPCRRCSATRRRCVPAPRAAAPS